MEVPQESPYVAILNKKTMSFLFFYKIGERGQNRSCLGCLPPVVAGDVGKESGRVNMVQILCTHVCNWKNGRNGERRV
jgi:hypothetical protein